MMAAIAAVLAHSAAAAPCAPSAPVGAAAVRALDAAVIGRMRALKVPGAAVAIVGGGQIRMLRGYGLARLSPRMPVDPARTLFRIGSVTKLFTYTAALQLAERGRLDVRRDVAAYLPWPAPARTALRGLTIDAIMAQRAGFENADLGYRFMWNPALEPTLGAFVARYRPARVRPAGEATDYSNYAPTLLGYAVERVSGQPYGAYVRDHILAPLGMRHTALEEPVPVDQPAPLGRMTPPLARDAAIGYRWSAVEGYQPVPYEHIDPAAAPAGSAFSTVADMACFMLAFLPAHPGGPRRLLADATIAASRVRRFPDRPDAPDFAHGWFNERIGRHPTYGHYGSMLGFTSRLLLVPDVDLGIFVVANGVNGWSLTADAPALLRLVAPGIAAPPPSAPLPRNLPPIEGYAGHYLTGVRSYTRLAGFAALGAGEATVSVEDRDHLRIGLEGEERAWRRIGADLFAAGPAEAPIRFVRDGAGDVVRFYHPMGHRSYERIPLWRTGIALAAASAIAAGIAVLLLVCLARARHRPGPPTRWVLALSALSALALPLLEKQAQRAMADDLVAVHWPPPALRALVLAGWGQGAAVIAILACVVLMRSDLGARWLRGAALMLAATQAVTLAMLAEWNLFAPTML